MQRIIGLDPGLRHTGWGIIESDGNRLRHLANGVVSTDAKASLAHRLLQIHDGLASVIADWRPMWRRSRKPSSTAIRHRP